MSSSLMSLDNGFAHTADIQYLYEREYQHGDVIVTRGLNAESMGCEIKSTSDAHKMCVAMVKQR